MKDRSLFVLAVPLVAYLLSACAPKPFSSLPPPLPKLKPVASSPEKFPPEANKPSLEVEETPSLPPLDKIRSGRNEAPPRPAANEPANITLNFDQERLPTLIQLIYGTILKKNFTLDPAVASRQDMVTLRTGPQTRSQVEQTARILLKSYGVAVVDVGGGFYRVVPDSNLQGYAPEIRRGRALPGVPMPLRPIFQLVELDSVRNTDVASWLRSMFGTKITAVEDATRNAIMLSGQADDIAAAMDAIQVLDQPGMKGRQSARINPVFLSADEMAKKLGEVMTAEGYSTAMLAAMNAAVTIVPVQATNAVIVFAAEQSILSHAVSWARELDRVSENRGGSAGYYTYQAKNTDAQKLATTIQQIMTRQSAGSSGATAPTTTTPSPGGATATPTATPMASAQALQLVVNAPTNTLIFKGSSEEYAPLLSLLQELDKPTKAALIEVTVAEVDLTDALQMGVELNSDMVKAGALAALTGGAGLTVQYLRPGSTRALDMITALASENRAQVLSSPRLMARNGETAMIQVGQQVPIVTSQLGSAASSSVFSNNSNLLTSVQYKDVGVILKVKPVIYSGDRIELEVSQEVSDAQTTETGVNSSPTINTKKVETRLALKDGSTVMLGGLISNDASSGNSGVPLLKDLPILGQLFRKNSEKSTRRELIVLITPYTVLDDEDAQQITEAFRKQLPWSKTTENIQAVH